MKKRSLRLYWISQIMNEQKWTLVTIFCLALLVRLLFVLFTYGPLIWYDEIQYDAIARGMLRGEGYGSTLYAPLQPFFLLSLYSVFGDSLLTARLAQALLGAATCVLIFYVGNSVFNRKIGLLAGFISILYPYFVYITGILYPTTLFTFLLTMSIVLLLAFYEEAKKSYLIAAGTAFGLAVLCIPGMLFSLPVIPLWLLLTKRFGLKETTKTFGILLLCILVVISPWAIRNSLLYRQFVFLTTEGGHAFWQGNNPYFNGMRRLSADEIPGELQTKLHGLSEVEKDKVFLRESVQFIKENPLQFIRLYLIKFINFWRIYPRTISQNRYTSTKTVLISVFSYGMLLPFAILGVFRSRKHAKKAVLLLLIPISLALGYSLFLTCTRYRIPIDPYIIIFASVGLRAVFEKCNLLQRNKNRCRSGKF